MVFGNKSPPKTKLFERPLDKLFNPKAINILPEPIRCLLNELYLRGPSTVGIFRKSPNAKHCRDLRHKLETDGQTSTIQQFQVNVIASVFKEWLRSLPDCLLMSRLYPQWIDVGKLIDRHEPRQECNRIIRLLLERLNEANLILLQALICVLWHIANNSEHNMMSSINLGVCVGQSLLNDEHQHKNHRHQPLGHSLSSSSASSNTSPTSALFAFSAATFARRHRRARSQSVLPTALSMSSLTQLQSSTSSNHLNSAQETAKYVPILVAFMIDNARELFGQEVLSLFGPPIKVSAVDKQETEITATSGDQQQSDDSMLADNENINQSLVASSRVPDQLQGDSMGSSEDELVGVDSIKMMPAETDAGAITSTTSPYTDVCDGKTTSAEAAVSAAATTRQQRPLSATESTGSSSRASSSTSDLHSESPAFSSEPDSHDGCCVSSSYDVLPSYRMPKIPFQYTTSCYGGEAVLYHPSYAHWKHQQQQQQQQQLQQQQFQHQQQHERANYQLCGDRKSGVECHHQRHSLPCNNQLKQYNYHQQQFRQHPQYPHHHQSQQQPQRSNVMLLRDYYLSLERQNQQFNSYRVERHQQRQQLLSHYQQQQQLLNNHQRQQQLLTLHQQQQQQQLLSHQQQHLLPHHQQQRQHLLTHHHQHNHHQHHHQAQQQQQQQRAPTLHWSAH